MKNNSTRAPFSPENLDPPVAMLDIELAPPSLEDNTADVDRLARAVARELGIPRPRVPLEGANRFSKTLRDSGFKVSARVAFFPGGPEVVHVQRAGEGAKNLGVALDLGSTTMTFYFLDLTAGEIAKIAQAENPQAEFGDDILSRVHYATGEDGLGELFRRTIERVNSTIEEGAASLGWRAEDICAMAVAGNTAMTHFFLGLDPFHLIREPYIPVMNRIPPFRAKELGLSICPGGFVYVFPNVGSYFGGDLLAGILYSRITEKDEVSILVDVGTNAEIVLGCRDWLLGCAGAAGPALEGGVVAVGMTAKPGAIERVRVDRKTGEPEIEVMGGEKPVGICGSGLIDLVAELFLTGVLDVQGRVNKGFPSRRIIDTEDGRGYLLAEAEETGHGEDIVVTNTDIHILLKSKAAMYTILNVVLGKVGLTFDDVARFYMAGTFGNSIDPEMAVSIGMIPDIPREKLSPLGNAAGLGACRVLFDRGELERVEEIRDMITYVELNVDQELMNTFRGATFLPHTDPSLFPSVKSPSINSS